MIGKRGEPTRRIYLTRVAYSTPFTTTPLISWSSFGTTKCAAAMAASSKTSVNLWKNMMTFDLDRTEKMV